MDAKKKTIILGKCCGDEHCFCIVDYWSDLGLDLESAHYVYAFKRVGSHGWKLASYECRMLASAISILWENMKANFEVYWQILVSNQVLQVVLRVA